MDFGNEMVKFFKSQKRSWLAGAGNIIHRSTANELFCSSAGEEVNDFETLT